MEMERERGRAVTLGKRFRSEGPIRLVNLNTG